MSVGKIIAYIAAAILIFFGVLFIWAAFGTESRPAYILVGIITVGIGLGLIYLGGKQKPAQAGDQNVTLNIDLPGNVNLESLKCQNCGGSLSPDNIKMVAGAPVVTCPFCGSTYQLTEEPKW